MIFGQVPVAVFAAFSASTQKLESSVFETRHVSTARVAQSMITVKYREASRHRDIG